MKSRRILFIILAVLLIISVGINIVGGVSIMNEYPSYLQSIDSVYTMESGILYNCRELREGVDLRFTYDLDHPDYAVLKESYDIEKIAGEGSELSKALNLMHEFSPRLTHKSDYDNSITQEALPLLEYSLNNPAHGINCRAKAQILNEMCLSLGIYSRKLWLMPSSKYDRDCHVVNEIWDSELEKWVMLDITQDTYWIDEKGTPLSVMEIRDKGAMQEFCTPISPGESSDDPQKLKDKHIDNFLYIMKNMVYTEYISGYSVGEGSDYYLCFPKNLNTGFEQIVSREAVERSPKG